MIDQLRQIAIFQTVADAGSFRGAAGRLNLSPSVISHHISQLETRLGIPLIYRSTRRLSLTEAGRDMLQASRRMTDAAAEGLAAVQNHANRPSGRLRIAMPALYAQPPFASAISALSRAFPDVRLSCDLSDDLVKLEGSEFDVAIRGGTLPDSSYRCRKILEVPMCIVAAPAYLEDRALPATVGDIESWDSFQFQDRTISQFLSGPSRQNAKLRLNMRAQANSVAILYHFVLAGLGIAPLPVMLVRDDLKNGRLVRLLPDLPRMSEVHFAVWPKNAAADGLASMAVDFLVTYFHSAGLDGDRAVSA